MNIIRFSSWFKVKLERSLAFKNYAVLPAYFSTVQNSRQKWYTVDEVERMSRRELQKWCKKLRLRANSKTVQLRRDLLDFHQDVLSKSNILNYPFLPWQTQTIDFSKYDVKPLCEDKILFVHKNIEGMQPNVMIDGSPQLVRHYMTGDNEDTQEGVVKVDNVNQIPSVSGVLRSTIPKNKLFAILHWTKKQKALLGEDVFREKMNTAKRNGTEFHRFIHHCLVDRNLDTKVPERIQGFVQSTKQVFSKLGDAITSEHRVFHEHLGYKGKVDVLASYDGNPCIIEWKTSGKRKESLEQCGDYPLQVVAYAGAVNCGNIFGFKVKHGVIVIAYEDGSPADVHCLDLQLCKELWENWLLRLHQFYGQESK